MSETTFNIITVALIPICGLLMVAVMFASESREILPLPVIAAVIPVGLWATVGRVLFITTTSLTVTAAEGAAPYTAVFTATYPPQATCSLDPGDESPIIEGCQERYTHTYRLPGVYDATFRVGDNSHSGMVVVQVTSGENDEP